ncbi:MAG: tetratricopeptide repeat protein [Bradymonadales bacterium]|nr:tetratricopeptide repeat protein [Bradymonadales bacterium]
MKATMTILLGLLLVLGSPSAWAQTESSTRAGADQAMSEGDYEQAVQLYRQTLDQSEGSADLHYNLGLAYAHLDRLPLAVYHLSQASYLDPGDRNIREGLALVKAELRRSQAEPAVGDQLTKGEPAPLFWLAFFHRLGRTRVELVLLGACWLAFLLLLLWRRMKPSGSRDLVLVLTVLSFLLLGGAATYRIGAAITHDSVQPGVVVASEPVARRGPDPQAPRVVMRDLAGGATVLIRDEREDWLEVALSDEVTGWLPGDQVRRIVVPNW